MANETSADSEKNLNPEGWWSKFRQLLEEQTQWPCEYLFKFIVPKAGLEALREVFGDKETIVRAYTRGRYVSVTARFTVQSPDDVITIYMEAGKIEGVISL